MTIYDVPVHDTKFFPVSGDMLRQMKHDEDQRLRKENDTGTLAKESPDAVSSIPQEGNQAMLHVSVSHDDLVVHPIWCDPEQCIAPDFAELGDRRLHHRKIGHVEPTDGTRGIEVTMTKFDDTPPTVIVEATELTLPKLEELILLLDRARIALICAGGEG